MRGGHRKARAARLRNVHGDARGAAKAGDGRGDRIVRCQEHADAASRRARDGVPQHREDRGLGTVAGAKKGVGHGTSIPRAARRAPRRTRPLRGRPKGAAPRDARGTFRPDAAMMRLKSPREKAASRSDARARDDRPRAGGVYPCPHDPAGRDRELKKPSFRRAARRRYAPPP